jgi:hypothetical protein
MIYIYKLTKEPADVIRAPRDACVVILVHLLFFFTMVFDEILLSLIIVATLTDLLNSRNAFFFIYCYYSNPSYCQNSPPPPLRVSHLSRVDRSAEGWIHELVKTERDQVDRSPEDGSR